MELMTPDGIYILWQEAVMKFAVKETSRAFRSSSLKMEKGRSFVRNTDAFSHITAAVY